MAKKEAKQMALTPVVTQTPKINFDAWWAVTSKKVPQHHYKEVVMADFKARGLSANETAGAFDKALELYGVKLK